MYLKSIEVQGFKSFANKINFEFQNGITGIVGPNGSGKSNVSDAVRWVLGEQSAKQLRGGNMQDVIFSGTETRKPQGFAYVAITMDNSDRKIGIDFDEVKVSRRLYRSGESEYMINDVSCRLKDVNELFFDTGIGQEGYSIIGQGQIEMILSGKTEERRELFDEAAGITKFKKRKVLAEKKLENERANLIRVSDILSELEKQVAPLEKQSQDAREYLRLKEELKSLEVNLFLRESDSIKEQLSELDEKESILKGDQEEAGREEEKLKADYEDLETLLQELDGTLTSTREQISQYSVNSGDLTGKINVLREQINTEHMNAEHIETRLNVIASETGLHLKTREDYQKQKSELDFSVSDKEEKRKQAEKSLLSADENIMLLDQKIEDTKNAVIDAINERAEISAKGQRFEAILEQIQVRSSEVVQKLLKIKSDESVLDVQLEEEKKKLEDADEESRKLADALKNSEAKSGEDEKEVFRLSKVLNDAQGEYQSSSARLESLRNLSERYDGYGSSIKHVMETRDRVKGIHGVVADLIAVDKEYETAIETALGGKIQNIVTDSEETAKLLIEHLKKNQFGRATFLPLTSIGNTRKREFGDVMKEAGVIGSASGLVRSDPRYKGLIDYLLGEDIVVTDIDRAIAIERKYHYSYRIVTREGELINKGGSISGGAFRNSSNLLGRKREIEELEEITAGILRKAEGTQKELTDAENLLKEEQQNTEEIKKKQQEILLNRNSIRMNLDRILEKKNEVADSAADYETEHTELEHQNEEIGSNRTQLSADIHLLEEKRLEMENASTGYNRELEEAKAGRESFAAALSRSQIEESEVKQKLSFTAENLKRVGEEIDKLNEEKETLKSGTEESEKRISEKAGMISASEAEIEIIRTKTAELNRIVEDASAKKESKAGEQKLYFEKRDAISTRLSALDKDIFRVQSQHEKCEEKLGTRVSYILSEYDLTYDTASLLRDEALNDLSGLKKDIEVRKTDIRQLGNVNVNAIDDYREISTRYEFLKTQHDDLKKAEEALLKIISELDQGMRKQFEEQFQLIAEEFNKVFKELFGGGRGEIRLEEGVDMLEAGISIIAEPPGKKLQNMMQLSGGEKSLTAIALLFAIQNLKPSPFALLDEIEAALDDSNVDRFAKYLKKLTDKTQFIVITHRRGTMIAADRLYGITMQEKGVSTLVSVKLIEDKLDD